MRILNSTSSADSQWQAYIVALLVDKAALSPIVLYNSTPAVNHLVA